MSLAKIALMSSLAFIVFSSSAACALENGWYHTVEVQPPCGRLSEAVIFVEGDKLISASVGDASVTVENPKKITATKTKMIFDGSNLHAEADVSKRKNNLIDIKILNGASCIGSQVTLSK